ncbi:MAG: DUF4019 domain-containing protein [Nibricoccus sp.]
MKVFTTTLLLILSVGLFACTSLNQTVANQNALVGKLHEQFNAGDYEAIWKSAHPRFQGEADKEKFVQYLRLVREKLGKYDSTANKDRRFSTANGKTTVFLVQDTAFANARAVETFTLQMDGEQPSLLAYNIQSKLLESR